MSKSHRSDLNADQGIAGNSMKLRQESCFYREAGVDVRKGQAFVKLISRFVGGTATQGIDVNLGGFGAVSDPKKWGFEDPLIVAAADGVGTKLLLTQQANKWEAIGQDLVAMSVNDLVAQGAAPLFFLDYIACSSLEGQTMARIVSGITLACHESGCALIGGETAEMPSLYQKGHFDLAGFAVGAVERQNILPKQDAQIGDVVIGLASNGVHANGFSLIRKILNEKNIKDEALISELLEPTRIYVQPMLKALEKTKNVRGIAHITGGGFVENLPRALTNKDLAIELNASSWPQPDLFKWLMREGDLPAQEMVNIFNCGIGMAVIVAEKDAPTLTDSLKKSGETTYQIGHIVKREGAKIKINHLERWR